MSPRRSWAARQVASDTSTAKTPSPRPAARLLSHPGLDRPWPFAGAATPVGGEPHLQNDRRRPRGETRRNGVEADPLISPDGKRAPITEPLRRDGRGLFPNQSTRLVAPPDDEAAYPTLLAKPRLLKRSGLRESRAWPVPQRMNRMAQHLRIRRGQSHNLLHSIGLAVGSAAPQFISNLIGLYVMVSFGVSRKARDRGTDNRRVLHRFKARTRMGARSRGGDHH